MRYVDMAVELEFFLERDGETHEVSQARIPGTTLVLEIGEVLRDFPVWDGAGYRPGRVQVDRVIQDSLYPEIFRVWLREA
jgi:hypothetical protein